MASDARRLSRLTFKDHTGRVHRLHSELCKPRGRFCDEAGMLSPHSIRVFYMMAGILPPQSDAAEDLFNSIQQNIVLINAYMEHSGPAPSPPPGGSVKIAAKTGVKRIKDVSGGGATGGAPPLP